jgi:cytochrome c oxidase subunit 3
MIAQPAIATPAARLGSWLFLAADAMFFLGLIGAYMVLRSGHPQAAVAELATHSRAPMAINVILLLGGSVAMMIAEKRNRPAALAVTFFAGAGFLAVTFHYLVVPPLPMDGFHACHFMLTILQALHVAAAMIAIFVLLIQAARSKVLQSQMLFIRTLWLFGVAMWILLFPILFISGT